MMITKRSLSATYPKDADPIDYAFFINMMVFADICGKPDVQAKIVELKEKLSKFNPHPQMCNLF